MFISNLTIENWVGNKCVDLQTVLLASKTFVELGKLEESVTWEEEKTFAVL